MGLASSQASAGWIWLSASGLDQSPIVKQTDTLKPFCCPECAKVSLLPDQSGQTCALCAGTICPASKFSTADSLVRTYQLRALERAWRESEADFTLNSKGLCAKQSQLSSFLKTSLQSGHADLAVWCGDFPSSGMTVAGQLYQPLKLEVRSSEKGGFFLPRPTAENRAGRYLPRPTAKHYGSNKGGAKGRTGEARHSIHQLASRGLLPGHPKGALNRRYLELVMGFPMQWTEIDAWATEHLRHKRARRSCD